MSQPEHPRRSASATGRRALVWAALLVAGFDGSAGAGPQGEVPARGLRDGLGHEVALERPPERIISLSPNLTEILFAVGVARERIAGVTRYCDHPPEVEGLTRVGGIVDPSIEGILGLHPDLVLATRGNPRVVLDRLRAAGVPVFAFDSQDGIEHVVETMRLVARLTVPDDTLRAAAAVSGFVERLACLRAVEAGVPEGRRPTVYYHDPASPDWTAGPGTHVSEAIRLAGGRNLGDEGAVAWPRISLEVLVARQPDWILVAAPSLEAAARARIESDLRARPGWRGLRAVREGRLCFVDASAFLRPGPRLLEPIAEAGRCLHPGMDWSCGR